VVMSLASAALMAQETKVKMKDLPAPVQKTVQDLTKTAKLKGLSKEIENGKTFYEAETTVDGKSRDVLIDPDGKVVEVEEATTLTAVPDAARKAFQQQAGASGKIVSVETVTKGPVVDYEAVIQKGGKKSEFAVHADGSPVKE
jgi:uncharacterized membrane protein YkoI